MDSRSNACTGYGRTPRPGPAARGGCWFRGRGVEAHLGVVPDFRPSRKGHPGFRVDDLDVLAARPAAHGHEAVRDGSLPGHRRFHSGGRLGNRLEFPAPLPGAADA
ncbi:glyoxalase [Kitasatospora sp. NPDC057692]|uniref:glyoxalase n=1 Tax=Kitasatospora sp. NPDC057692 TaxID=3346215 RepID=UPI0036A0D2BB